VELPKPIENVVQVFTRLPGIGEKTATRLALSLMNWKPEDISRFSDEVRSLLYLKKCAECGAFSERDICQICASSERSSVGTLCVVENIMDFMAIERGDSFKGLFHVLGGVLNPILGIGPQELKLEKIIERVERLNIHEVILALSPSIEGDATCSFIKNILPGTVSVQRIGFGIPIGGSLEYLDSLTIKKALENRKQL